MKITIKINNSYGVNNLDTKNEVELIYEEETVMTEYPRIVTTDKYDDSMTKSNRLVQAISELVDEAIKMSVRNEKCQE